MEVFLGKITQQAMNYAIRSGIAITSTYAMRQCSRLLETVKGNEYDELAALRDRLESKIRIISPAIDMIELISARGNTSLESAVTLTKSLRWEIQSLGQRLAKAVNMEELSRRSASKARTRAQSELEVKLIVQAIRKVLERIEDAVPLINLAITTSGANLSTTLPATVSPSRLLQASTFLTAGDTQYSIQPGQRVQIGPTFTLSMYMLFAGHAYRSQDQHGNLRETTWKEVVHKARVKLLRTSLEDAYQLPLQRQPDDGWDQHSYEDIHANREDSNGSLNGVTEDSIPPDSPLMTGEGKADEFAYQLLIIEDFEDDRVHSFGEDEPQPGPFEDVAFAGIREVIPLHQVSKLFYADTGKILNIGGEGEASNPVLLLKRDVHAIPPRRMMERVSRDTGPHDEFSYTSSQRDTESLRHAHEDEHSEVEAQLRHEERAASLPPVQEKLTLDQGNSWRLPLDLDPEWIALEVYTEDNDSDDDDEGQPSDAGTPEPRPRARSREASIDPQLTNAMSLLHLNPVPAVPSSPPADATAQHQHQQLILHSPLPLLANSTFGGSGPIRTSLSLLEMLIRLTALQQFQQTSHLSIPDELLNFFLSESSTTGAGSDGEERRRKRWEARRKVGFDPYDESPVKRRGENGAVERHIYDPYNGPDEWPSAGNGSPWPRQYRDDSERSPSSPVLAQSRETQLDRSTPSSFSSRRNNTTTTSTTNTTATRFSSAPPPDRRHTSSSPFLGPAEGLPKSHRKASLLRDDSPLSGAGLPHHKENSPLRRGASVEDEES